jgi:hypothetical protein
LKLVLDAVTHDLLGDQPCAADIDCPRDVSAGRATRVGLSRVCSA